MRLIITSLLVGFCLGNASAAAPPPNVVLVVADDLGYADLGCTGGRTPTPHLDRLAAGGTRFTDFCVSQAVCTASRASLMTGCYANRVSMAGALNHESRVGLHPAERLLPEVLKAKGYATGCFGKWHLGHRPAFLPTRRGFDQWEGLPYSNDNGPRHPTVRGLPPLPWYRGEAVVERDPDQGRFTGRITDKAVEFIGRNADRPFFLYLPHVMPHVPIAASAGFAGKTGLGGYADVVAELDAGVGAVLAALDAHKLADRTLVLFLSDNGPFLSYGDHAGRATPLREGKLTAFEGGVRVPAIARWPGKVPAGRVSDDFVTSLDLLPTLTKLAGGESGAKPIDGVDVGPALLGTGPSPRRAFWYYSGDELHAVRAGRWKLHLPHDYLTVAGAPGRDGKPSDWEKAKPAAMSASGVRGIASRHGYRVERIGQSLFDLAADPGETTDMAAKHPDVVRELLAEAERARAELGDAIPMRSGTGVRPCGRE